jgi:hypothetical protein
MTRKLHSILDEIIERNRAQLHKKIEQRREEMDKNNLEHLSLYSILGFSEEEGLKIDFYQNIGRFLYTYAGALVEQATVAVLQNLKGRKKYTNSQ